jgi:hypothetical protein
MFRLSGVHCGFLMHVPDTGTRHFPRSSRSPGVWLSYEGQHYRSLTVIAERITGTHSRGFLA